MERCISVINVMDARDETKTKQDRVHVSCTHQQQAQCTNMTIRIEANKIHALNCCVRNLGAYFNKQICTEQIVRYKCRVTYAQSHNIGKVRTRLDQQSADKLLYALVNKYIDYCNRLIGIPKYVIRK